MTAPNQRELRNTLEMQISHLTLAAPVDDIIDRGNRLRRKRQRGLGVGVVAGGFLVAAGVSIALPSGSSPLVPEAAAWGPSMVNVEPPLLAEAGKQCAHDMRTMGWDMPADTKPIAADTRNGETVAFYRIGKDYGVCTFTGATARALQIRSSTNGDWDELPPDVHVDFISAAYAVQTPGAPTRDGVGAAQVSADTTRVTIDVAGQTLDAAVGNGVAAFWTPDGTSLEQIDDAVLTAYDADGNVLSSTTIA